MCRVSCTTGSGTVLSPAARLGGGRGGGPLGRACFSVRLLATAGTETDK
jgi:hypothetical protein